MFIYSNEKEVGRGLKKSGIPRSDVFVVTKVWGDGHGYERCKAAFAESLRRYADSFFSQLFSVTSYHCLCNRMLVLHHLIH